MIATLYASHLVDYENGFFSPTEQTREYLLKDSPNYYGYFWDMMYDNSKNFSLKNLKSAIKKSTAQIYEERELFNTHIQDPEKVRKFTQSMHSVSMSSAIFWPSLISLAQHHEAVDIGGGSGAHAIGMVTNWPHLTCTVFDLPEVCAIATDYIQQYGLGDRIKTHGGNMWEDDFPDADLHLYSNVLHDWPDEKNLFLAKKAMHLCRVEEELLFMKYCITIMRQDHLLLPVPAWSCRAGQKVKNIQDKNLALC